MSHQTLYRKYRPKTFGELKGQDHIVNAFTKALKENKIAHAYLFSGGRGTGKTSVARIIAHELGTSDVDIYEIDAASNRGIDEVRTLRESVQTLPFSSPFKVYIIDEAHMLTPQAANALLKTLEEPPAHVIFILATTDKHKLPKTILSRTQQIEFNNATEDILIQLLEDVALSEGVTLDEGVAALLAKKGNGSFRDAFSFLETALLHQRSGKLSLEDISHLSSYSDSSLALDFILNLQSKQKSKALELIPQNTITADFLYALVGCLRDSLYTRFIGSSDDIVKKYSKEDYSKIQKIGLSRENAVNATLLRECILCYEGARRDEKLAYTWLIVFVDAFE